jgi:hypothetical protein
MPAGEFKIKIGDLEKTVELRDKSKKNLLLTFP